MRRHIGLSVALTTIILLAVLYTGISAFNVVHPSALPFVVRNVNAYSGVVAAVPGVALPKGLHAGDQIDLAEQRPATRVAIAVGHFGGQSLAIGHVYRFVVQRGSERNRVWIKTIGLNTIPGFQLVRALDLFLLLFIDVIGLAVVWRGRDRAAAGLALFAIANLVGIAMKWVPSPEIAGLAAYVGQRVLFLLARAGFYVMAVSMVGVTLGPRVRVVWRTAFLLVLGVGAVFSLIGPAVFVATGWGLAAIQGRPLGLILTASYLVPVALLFVGYYHAEIANRSRLRWMLWGGGLLSTGILAGNMNLAGSAPIIASEFAQSLAMAIFLYAILRHRVVDVKVVVSRTLVYAMTTSLVLGLFALFESLIERTTLGHRASLMLELAVPLGLGVSLSTVHRRIDTLVDRVIFRRQYREEMALRRFAIESAFVNQPDTLLDLAVEQILLHVGAPWVAFYEYSAEGYRRVRWRGEVVLAATVPIDDLALVRLRAHDCDADLHELRSVLGREGYVFPLRVRDQLLGILVVGPRPDEHYATEERELMAHVAHAVGASLFALQARATEEQLMAARAEATSSATRESALLDALRALGAEQRFSAER